MKLVIGIVRPEQANDVLKALYRAEVRGFSLSTANALWAQKGYPWKPEYKKLVVDSYAAAFEMTRYLIGRGHGRIAAPRTIAVLEHLGAAHGPRYCPT